MKPSVSNADINPNKTQEDEHEDKTSINFSVSTMPKAQPTLNKLVITESGNEHDPVSYINQETQSVSVQDN